MEGAKAIPTPPAGTWGIVSEGNGGGGIFRDSDSEAEAWLSASGFGIKAYGSLAAGYFHDSDNTGSAWVGYGEHGIEAYGSVVGGYFHDSDNTGSAWVGFSDRGIEASGTGGGGYFADIDSFNYAYVGYVSYKISGNGSVSFVQNHPHDPSAVVVYAAPEGDEVATYTRGTARLQAGEVRVALGETFRWVTNPDIGLTAHVTPRGDCNGMYVSHLTTEELVVRELGGGTSDCTFDYLVYGLRIGFEESTVVQEKQQEAYIPSMSHHRELATRRPDLARHTALARWTTQTKALGRDEPLDLSRAHSLRDLIGEYDPAVHGSMEPARPVGEGPATQDRARAGDEAPEARRAAASGRSAVEQPERELVAELPGAVAPLRDVYARSFRPEAADLASLLEVSEAVKPGDVLVVDPERPGMLRRAMSAADPTVVGVVAGEPGVVLGSGDEAGGARAAVTFAGIAVCKVDATYGPVYPGDLLVSSPTPGHAMRADVASPGTVLGKALEELTDGAAPIRILVMPR